MQFGRKFCFTLWESLLCCETSLNRTHTVSPNCSRKSFLAKLGGMIAGIGFIPGFLAKIGTKGATEPVIATVKLQPEQRAVSRKEGSY
jgi:hypothetical protein